MTQNQNQNDLLFSVYDEIKNPENPITLMLNTYYNHYRELGYDEPQSRFLVCWSIGYRPPNVENDEKGE